MAKKKQRKQQVSKGVTHQNPNRMGNRIAKSQRLEYKDTIAHVNNQRKAWRKGKTVMLTIANPDGSNTQERFIRVNANEVWGDWRYAGKVGSR